MMVPTMMMALLLAAALPARAQDANKVLQARTLAAACAGCHGTDGRQPAGATVPGLAGVPASTLSEQLKAFKAGTRPSTVMQQLAKGFSDAQIEQLAAYFAAQARN
ncbi:c-type cytochrome [Roseateles violae]|uniref:C-type cytochrome n=1 Tax=Roseateles violae TaxID=3058042 RepID=A0ABT8DJZ0_9BURK|nr:c-type cytochrome [Pelomonas sp. PFR6]MDN3918746.1 c-type cytochrome [Pelomonas sp. PFR6]